MSALLTRLLLLLFAPAVFAVNLPYTDLEGQSANLSDYRGRWVVANYWATWCPPCREEIPDLVLFHDQHKDRDAVVIGFNMEENLPRQQLRTRLERVYLRD